MYTIIMNSDKSLTKAIVRTIYKGENLVDTIQFLIPRMYGEIDMSEFVAELTYEDPQAESHTEVLSMADDAYKRDWLKFLLPIDTKLTDHRGEIAMRIQFKKDSHIVLRTGTTKLTVKEPEHAHRDNQEEGGIIVESGEIVVNPEGQEAGTYIKLVLANATNDAIYVNVGTMVDIYKTQANATQIQLEIDSSTREISATVVAESITATELAANAVTTAKIDDGNVTKTKLSAEVQASLDKADNADANAQEKAEAALKAAKKYTDDAIGDVDLSGIATNAGDIDKLEASLAKGGATANAIADAKKAGTDAQTAVANLTNNEVAALRTDVDALQAVEYVEITAADVEAMFAESGNE